MSDHIPDEFEADREPLDIDDPEHLAFIDDATPLALTDEEYRIEIEQLYALGELAKTDWPAGDDLTETPPVEDQPVESAEAQLDRLAEYLTPPPSDLAPEPGEDVVDYVIRLLEHRASKKAKKAKRWRG